MRSNKLGSLLFVSTLALGAVGCAGNVAGEATDYGPEFDADGRADGARTTARVNPGATLLNKFTACDNAWQNDTASTRPEEDYMNCYKKAVSETAWNIDWRNQKVDSDYTSAGHISNLRTRRTGWDNLCETLRQGHSSAYDSDMQDYYFYMYCVLDGEKAYGDAAIDFAYHYEDNAEQLEAFRDHGGDYHAFECTEYLTKELETVQDAPDMRRIYHDWRECVTDTLVAEARTVEGFLNRQYAGNPEATPEEIANFQSTFATTVADVNANAAAICDEIVTAGAYNSGVYFDDAEKSIPSDQCQVRVALWAFDQISKLREDAGGSFEAAAPPTSTQE